MRKFLYKVSFLLFIFSIAAMCFTACEQDRDDRDSFSKSVKYNEESTENIEKEVEENTGLDSENSTENWELAITKEAAGIYVIYSVVDDSDILLPRDLEQALLESNFSRMEDLNSIQIKDDGTVIYCSMGQKTKMEYDAHSMWPVNNPSDKAGYFLTGDTLTLLQNEAMLTFKKK